MGKVFDWVRGHAVVSVLIAFLLGIGAGAQSTANDSTTTISSTENSVDDAEDINEAEDEPEPEPEPEEPEYERPTKDDFKLKVKTLEKACFGSAGCLVDIRIGLVYLGEGKLDPTKTYELTYKVIGGEDSLTSTIDITGRSYTVDEHNVSTASSSAVLQAVITRVSAF